MIIIQVLPLPNCLLRWKIAQSREKCTQAHIEAKKKGQIAQAFNVS